MEIYLVGGAVRDHLMGLQIQERDWVVVGATPPEMLELGYKPVGKDFPVFLHPQTREEYALARTERKIGKGYKGFTFYADKSVSLEDDLQRRDLTINAIAQAPDGSVIDPYNGILDIKRKILRHVSAAFAEDPVRILRVARFAARFGDFTIDPATMELMRLMVKNGEVDALVPERTWQEFAKSLAMPYPSRFFTVLSECGASPILFPEITEHLTTVLQLLTNATKLSGEAHIRFAASLSPLTVAAIKSLCQRIKTPAEYRDLAIIVNKLHNDFANITDTDAEELLNILEKVDSLRKPQRLKDFLRAMEICVKKNARAISSKLEKAYNIISNITVDPRSLEGLTGEEIKNKLHKSRIEALNAKDLN